MTKKPKVPKKKKIVKYRVVIKSQWKDFTYQSDAREFARSVLQNDAVYFMECKKVMVDEE